MPKQPGKPSPARPGTPAPASPLAGAPTPPADSSSLISDRPAREDHLDFAPYRRTLSGIIADPQADTPFTIGVFGPWGTGKTTLLQMLMDDAAAAGHIAAWFTAWKYDKEDTLWRALLLCVIDAVRKGMGQAAPAALQALDALEDTLYQAIQQVEMGRLQFDLRDFVAGAVETGAQVALATIPGLNLLSKVIEELGAAATKEGPGRLLAAFKRAQKEVHIAQVSSLEQFQAQFQALVQEHIAPRRLVVLVDDLDRCLPQKAIDVLEAIKLFLDVPGCAFVLGLDRQVITHGIRVKYRDLEGLIDGERYLEKIVQLQFDLPPLEPDDVRAYVDSLAPRLPDIRCRDVFATGLGRPNPRRIKRMVNSYLFLSRVARERVERLGELNPVRLAKVVAIQHGNPALHQLLSEMPGYLADLERHYRAAAERGEGAPSEGAAAPPPLPEPLQALANSEALRALLLLCADDAETSFASLTPAEIRPYFTLVRSTAAPQPAASAPLPLPQVVPIPEGEFLRGSSDEEIAWLVNNTDWAKEWKKKGYFKDEQRQRSIHLSAYRIGRFPVTNAQYQAFVGATGRQPPQHWNGDAAPERISDHPVTYVSYDDALAYCAWLSERGGESFRLPTEAEWEKAARGADGRQYPWGNEFGPRRCNTAEGQVGGTTPVGQYSQAGGDSPYGCADMAGNVWEWCADWYAEDYYAAAPGRDPVGPPEGQYRVVRGGSWDDLQRSARCACRNRLIPNSRGSLGFRVVVAPPISPRS